MAARRPAKVAKVSPPIKLQYMTPPSLSGCAGGTFSQFQAPEALVRGILVYQAPFHPQEGGRHLVRASWRTDLPYAAA